MTEFEQVEVKSRAELRDWLSRNHAQRDSVWLVTFKKAAGERYLPYDAIVEEALCFGWIDSRPQSLDELRSMHMLSPRKSGSAWSQANKLRAERLIEQGLMEAPGLVKVETAKQDGSWEFLDDVQQSVLPTDLEAALAKSREAKTNFEAFPPSSKRIILEWIKQAKRPETRLRRIEETVAKAAKNVRANHYRQP